MSTSILHLFFFHMFSFIKNALFGSYSWMSHRTFIASSAVTAAFWLDQYGGRFASIFRRCPPSMFWGQWSGLPCTLNFGFTCKWHKLKIKNICSCCFNFLKRSWALLRLPWKYRPILECFGFWHHRTYTLCSDGSVSRPNTTILRLMIPYEGETLSSECYEILMCGAVVRV